MSTSSSAKVQSRGRVTLPAQLRLALDLEPGDEVEFIETSPGHYEVKGRAARHALLRRDDRAEARLDVTVVNEDQLHLPL